MLREIIFLLNKVKPNNCLIFGLIKGSRYSLISIFSIFNFLIAIFYANNYNHYYHSINLIKTMKDSTIPKIKGIIQMPHPSICSLEDKAQPTVLEAPNQLQSLPLVMGKSNV